MRLVIDHALLIDGTGATPIQDAVVQAVEGRIVYAGPRAQAPDLSDVAVFDAEGAVVMPGLIDTHVHLSAEPVSDFEGYMRALTEAESEETSIRNAKRALAGGVTSVRDLGGKGDSVLRAAARLRGGGEGAAARVIAAGTWLTKPGGHCHYAAREIHGPDDARKAVLEQFEAGARCIKVVATGGVLSSSTTATEQALDDETLEAVVGTARELGARVAAHAIGKGGIEAALRAGVDSIEHGCYVGDVDRQPFLDNPTWLVPTFSAPDGICRAEGMHEYAVAKAEQVTAAHMRGFADAVADGVRIACGTDAGTPANPIGEIWRELELMADRGLPLDRVFASATREAAQLLGVGDIGTLEVGHHCDALILEPGANPLETAAAYRQIATVIFAGEVV
ncbi:MAG: amidohydrolase family protein [Actinomycetota bacterium]